jgi:hypothetical protein
VLLDPADAGAGALVETAAMLAGSPGLEQQAGVGLLSLGQAQNFLPASQSRPVYECQPCPADMERALAMYRLRRFS